MTHRRIVPTIVRRAAFAIAALGAVGLAAGAAAPAANAAQPACIFGVNAGCGEPTLLPTYSSLASAANPISEGQAVTFTFSVADPTGSGIPGGTATFGFVDPVTQTRSPVATLGLTNGTTTWTPGSLPIGTDGLYAQYNANITYGSSLATYFEQVNPGPPAVQSIAPKKGPAAGGTIVTVTGQNLDATTAIMVGALPAVSFSCATSTTCTLVTPAQSGRQPIRITNATATSAPVKADRFGYRLPKP